MQRIKPKLPHIVFAVIEGGDVAIEIAVVAENDHLEIVTTLGSKFG